MRGRSWAAVVMATSLLLLGWTPSVRAAGGTGLTLQLTQRWNLVGSAGTWAPYAVTVHNDGPSTFSGEVRLVPDASFNGPYAADSFPPYRGAVHVAPGGQSTVLMYTQEPQGSYHAELRDEQGALITRATATTTNHANAAVAVLSGLSGADQRISAPLASLTRLSIAVSGFPSAAAFPADAAHLSGLNGLVLDDFDTGSLSAPQLRAIQDFVALGGALIEVGGPSWQRTLQPLPADLLAFQPGGMSAASLSTLAELSGVTSSASVQVMTGGVSTWARTAMASADGQPLLVEGAYGAGRVVAVTFDPMAAPLDTDLPLAAASWSQAVSRGLSGARGGSALFKRAFNFAPGGISGSGPGSWATLPGQLEQAFNDVPGSSPPYGLLVALLIGYILLVSLLSYAALRFAGRRGLFWVTVPVLAFLFSAGGYLVGFGARAQDYQVVQVQVQRLGPGGVVETVSFDGVLSPRRGDVRVRVPSSALVSTFIPYFGPSLSGGRDTVITAGPSPEVRFSNVPVWDMRPVQTLSVTHPFGTLAGPGQPIEAQLRLSQGRIRGQIVNHTSLTVRDVRLLSMAGAQASLVPSLRPGATAEIDVSLAPGSGGPVGKGATIVIGGPPGSTGDARQALLMLAASQAAGHQGELALVGLTDPTDTILVEGRRPLSSGRAAVVEPVTLRSTDTATAVPAARLVSAYADAGGTSQLDVYELEAPQSLSVHAGLTWSLAGPPAAISVEVYDWVSGTWRPVPGGSLVGAPSPAFALTPGERGSGLVRVRVHEGQPGQASITLSDLP
ncbi:MAG TPA: hypothetical protein VGO86_07240 [Candidatus Dormibacteraeota bacterium]